MECFLIDPELSLIAKHKQEFYDIGVIPFITEYKIVEMCFDKYKMFKICKMFEYTNCEKLYKY